MNQLNATILPQQRYSFFYFFLLCFVSFQNMNASNIQAIKDSLLSSLKENKDKNQQMKFYLQLSEMYLNENPDSAIFFSQQAIDLFPKTQNMSLYSDALSLLGEIYSKQKKGEKALESYKKALNISEKLQDKKRITTNWSNIGYIYKQKKHFAQALLAYFKALKKIDSLQQAPQYAQILKEIGRIYSEQNNAVLSLSYYNKALQLNQTLGIKSEQAQVLSEMGCSYFEVNENKKGLDLHLAALDIFLQIEDNEGLAKCYACIAHAYLDQKKFNSALDYAKKGVNAASKCSSQNMNAHTHIRLAEVYGQMGQIALAISTASKGVMMAQKIEDKQQERMGYLILAEIYKQKQEFKMALDYTEKAQAIYTALQNENNTHDLTDLQATYELEAQQETFLNSLNLLQQKQSNNLLFRRFVTTVSVLSFILFSVLAVAFYYKNRSEKELAEKNREISEQAAKLDELVKERTRALEISEANILAIMNNTKDSIWSVDNNLNIITLNRPLKDGISGELGILLEAGANIKGILPHEQYLFWKEKYERCLSGEHFIFEFTFQKKQYESTYEVSLNPIRDENGIIVGASTFCREITSRKQNEIEKMRLIQTLTESNKDLEQFAYIVSHNLRAPVARMGGLMQIFNENDSSDPINKFVFENLAKGAKELDEITHDLNAIVAVRSHAQEEKIRLSLSTIFEQVQKSLQNELELINAKVSSDFSAGNELYAVKSYMYNIFQNLLANTIKYRQLAKPLEVNVWTERKGSCMYLYFQDNGLGIDLEKNRKKMFGLYNRFHQHIKGKGIGLHIVKAQIEVMNCKIEVKSEVNNGTCFEICFPGDMVV